MVEFDMKTVTNIQEVKGDDLPANPYRSRFIHLLNLNFMFEFCIPTIQDYGAALKLNDWERKCYDRLFLFFSMCTTKGVADYQRTMYVHMILMDYWKEKKLPVFEMLRKNPTFFSEESGEIALSMLVNTVGTGAELPVARRYWQCLPLRERSFSIHSSHKKYRLISIVFYSVVS